MATEDFSLLYSSGASPYLAIWRPHDGFVWDTTTHLFVSSTANFAITPTEFPVGGGKSIYNAAIDCALVHTGAIASYLILGYIPAGGSPVLVNDRIVQQLAFDIENGSTVLSAAIVSTLVDCSGVGGSIMVDENYPTTGNLEVKTPDGAGIPGVNIVAYLTSDYTGGNRAPDFIRGVASTDVNGNWLTPMPLDPGDYTLVFSKPQVYDTTVKAVTVVG